MSANLPVRKRDYIRRVLGKDRASTNTSSQPNVPAPSQATSPQTHDASQDILRDALPELTEKERSIVQKYVASDVTTTIEAAYNAAQAQKAVCEQKRWPGSDLADKLLHWLDRFKSVGDIVANVDPIHVGLPWAGIRMLLEVLVADLHQMSALLRGMSLAFYFASRLQVYLGHYKSLPTALTTQNLGKALVALYAHILRFLATAIRELPANPASRKLKALWQASTLVDFELQCDKLGQRADIEMENCVRELRLTKWSVVEQWKQELDAALHALNSNIQPVTNSLNILHAKVDLAKIDLSKLFRAQQATYNSSTEGKLSLCLDGTRSEILRTIEQWADKPDGKSIFWLCGMAGTGKSTISRTVAQMFDKQQCLGASFFFKQGEPDRNNADHFFSTVAAQLADRLPDMRDPISAALDKDSFLCGSNFQVQFEKLLIQPLLSISKLPQQKFVIVIDALDECERHTDIRLFLKLLGQVEAKSGLRLRIFLTSRPELPIQLGFQQLDKGLHQDVVLEELQETNIQRDICAYFEDEFAKIRKDTPDTTLSDWPSKGELQALVDLAAPLFIFASTVCRFVSSMKPRRSLEMILEHRYAAMPSHMTQLYQPILDCLTHDKEKCQQNEIVADFKKIVGPIILAANPLSVSSLANLLNVQPEKVHEEIVYLLNHLHSVLEIPSRLQDPVRLLHLSFRDFLVDHDRKDQDFWIDEAETHKKLAHYCLRRLDDDGSLKSDICCRRRPGARRSEISTEQIQTYISSDVAYACTYWSFHLVKSESILCDDGEVHRFLQTHLLHWLEALSWLNRLSSARAYIDDLLSLTKKSDNSSNLAAFLQDSKRFLRHNCYCVDLAPLQIYHSAVAFAPTQSLVRQNFSGDYSELWPCLPDAPLHWNTEVLRIQGHEHVVWAAAFSPDGLTIASASSDRTIRIWNMEGEQLQLFRQDTSVHSVAFSPDGQMIVSTSIDETVRLWSLSDHKMRKFSGHKKSVNAAVFSPDGQLIASASEDATLWLWDLTGKQATRCIKHEGSVKAVAFSPDGQVIASASSEIVWLRKRSTCDVIQMFWHGTPTTALAFSPDGHILASTLAGSATVHLRAVVGERSWKLEGHTHAVEGIAFSPDGKLLASASMDETIRIWSVATKEQIRKVTGHSNWLTTVVFSPDGLFIASASHDHTVRLWSVVGEETLRDLQQIEERGKYQKIMYELVLSPDGQLVVSLSDEDVIELWSMQTGQHICSFRGHDQNASGAAFSPDGRMLVSCSYDNSVRLWDVTTKTQIRKLGEHNDCVSAVAFSPNGKVVASLSYDGSARLWDIATGEQTKILGGYEKDLPVVIAFSPNGKTIALASSSNSVKLWNTATGQLTQEFVGHEENIMGAAFSPDGQVLVSGSDDSTLRLWNVITGEQIRSIEGHEGGVQAVAFSPDGQLVASVASDLTLRVWNAKTGEIFKTIFNINKPYKITFSEDGKLVQTDVGTFALSDSYCTARTMFLERRGHWLCYRDEDVLWLPHDYRDAGICSVMHGNTYVTGKRKSVAVRFYRFRPSGVFLDAGSA